MKLSLTDSTHPLPKPVPFHTAKTNAIIDVNTGEQHQLPMDAIAIREANGVRVLKKGEYVLLVQDRK